MREGWDFGESFALTQLLSLRKESQPSFLTLTQLVKLALNNGVLFCAAASLACDILGPSSGGRAHVHACSHLRCHMAACSNRPCSTAGGRLGAIPTYGSFPPEGCRIMKVVLSNKNSGKQSKIRAKLGYKAPSASCITTIHFTEGCSHINIL